MYLLHVNSDRVAQHGIGAFVAVTTGVQFNQIITAANGTDATVGGIFELLFPTYYLAGERREKLTRAFIKSEIRALPSANIAFYGVGAGATF